MIIRDYAKAKTSARSVRADGWESVRLLLQDDGMGFSFHITTIFAGAVLPMHYKRHLESVYCMSGRGSIEDSKTGEVTPIRAGVMYALDKHDRHVLRADEDMQMACVFNPPLRGDEVHDETGAYPLHAEAV